MVGFGRGYKGGECEERKVDSRIGYKIRLKFDEIYVDGSFEPQRSGY